MKMKTVASVALMKEGYRNYLAMSILRGISETKIMPFEQWCPKKTQNFLNRRREL